MERVIETAGITISGVLRDRFQLVQRLRDASLSRRCRFVLVPDLYDLCASGSRKWLAQGEQVGTFLRCFALRRLESSAGRLGYLRDLGPKPRDAAPDQGRNDQDREEEEVHDDGRAPALLRGNQPSLGFGDLAGHSSRPATDREPAVSHSSIAP
jgi:hypothetical protein